MLADVVKYCQVYSQRPKVKEYPDGDADFWHQAWDVAFTFSQDAMKGGVVTMTVMLKSHYTFFTRKFYPCACFPLKAFMPFPLGLFEHVFFTKAFHTFFTRTF